MAGISPAPPERGRSSLVVRIAAVAVALACVVAAAFLVVRSWNPASSVVGLDPGNLAPDFTIADVNGTEWSLRAHLGNVVLVDFMGVRCSACDSEMLQGTLQAASRNFSARGLSILSVDVGTSLGTNNATEAWRFIHGVGVDGSRWEPGDWPVALDGQGLALAYRSRDMLPMKYLIDRTGHVAWANLGLTTPAQLVAAIRPLL